MAKDAESDREVARMTSEDLSNFMAKEQKVEMSVEECEKLIQAFEPTDDKTALTMEGKIEIFSFVFVFDAASFIVKKGRTQTRLTTTLLL